MTTAQLQEIRFLGYLYSNWGTQKHLSYEDVIVDVAPYIGDNKEFDELIVEFDKNGYLSTNTFLSFDKKTQRGTNREFSISYKGIQHYKNLVKQKNIEDIKDDITLLDLKLKKNWVGVEFIKSLIGLVMGVIIGSIITILIQQWVKPLLSPTQKQLTITVDTIIVKSGVHIK